MQTTFEGTQTAIQSSMITSAFNSLKTGNATLDMLLSFMLINLAGILIAGASKFCGWIYSWLTAKVVSSVKKVHVVQETFQATLEDTKSKDNISLLGSGEEKQKMLIVGILDYVMDNHMEELKSLGVKLINPDKNASYNSDRDYYLRYNVRSFPTLVDVKIGFEGTTFSISYNYVRNEEKVNKTDRGDSIISDTNSNLGSVTVTGPKGCGKQMQKFFTHVWKTYIDKHYPHIPAEVPKRFCYLSIRTDYGLRFRQYSLENRRTFDATFFPQKEQFLKTLDNFLNQSGGFANPNVVWKLGILLHGPPGCGKTTFIKSLANYTGRSIQMVDLTMVRNNEELQKMFFGSQVEGENTTWTLPQNKRIIVCEDFDAGSTTLHKRLTQEEKKNKTPEEDASKTLEMTSGFNMSGFLNTLDGIVEPKGLMWVFTTNMVDNIDPAVLREGRMSIHIHMSHMKIPEMVKMFQFYFPSARIEPSFFEHMDGKYIPAQVECCCQYSTGVSDALQRLRNITTMY